MAPLTIGSLILTIFSILPPSVHYLASKRASGLDNSPLREKFMPEISIFLPFRNESTNVERKIREVLGMNYPLHKIRILVVDSMSEDGTADLAEQVLIQEAREVLRWDVIRLDSRGKSRAVNHALELIETDFFVMMDADSMPQHDCLGILMQWFEDNSIGAVCGQQNLELGDPDFHYRSRFNTIRVAESLSDSTPIFEGSLCAFRVSAIGGKTVNEEINADDSQLAMIVRSNGYKAIMDPRLRFGEVTSMISRPRKLRRAQGLVRALLFYRGLCSGKGRYSVIMASNIYFYVVFPWLFLSGVTIFLFSTMSFVLSGGIPEVYSISTLIFILATLLSKNIQSLLSGCLLIIEAQLLALFGHTLVVWEA